MSNPGRTASGGDAEAMPPDREAGVVLMADRSTSAPDMARALREDGFGVLTCDAIALPERAARLDPEAIIVDLEQPNVDAALDGLASLRRDRKISAIVVLVGNPDRLGDRVVGDDVLVMQRPVDVPSLVEQLWRRLDPPSGPGLEPLSQGKTSSNAGEPSSIGSASASDLMLSDFPALAGLSEVEGILPELRSRPGESVPPTSLSPAIESLLEASRRRVAETDPDVGTVAYEPDIPVPPDMMALVDDLLATDDAPPPTQGGMSLAAMLSPDPRPYEAPASSPMLAPEDLPPEPPRSHADFAFPSSPGSYGGIDSEPSFQPGTHADAAASSHGHHALTPIADEETNIPALGTQVGSPVSPRTGDLHHQGAGLQGAGPALPHLPPHLAVSPPSVTLADSATAWNPGPFAPTSSPEAAPPVPSSGAAAWASPATSRGSERPRPSDTSPPMSFHRLEEVEVGPESPRPEQGDPIMLLAHAVRHRATGALALSDASGQRVRLVLLRDGDIANAASDHPDDALLPFLIARGDLSPEVAQMRLLSIPQSGRHAAAALIAHGFLSQDDLWPVLRAHAEWIVGRALLEQPSLCRLDLDPPERLRAEPNVFGGAAGVEILIESVRRVLVPEEALRRLGGPDALVAAGAHGELLAESALGGDEAELLLRAAGTTVRELVRLRGPELLPLIYALAALGILEVEARRPAAPQATTSGLDPLDVDAVRRRIGARLALVHDGDYFSLLGVPSSATAYDIRRAYLELRRTFEPSRLITAATMDLRDQAQLIVDVLDEAYEVLRDPHRCSRYRRAIEATRL